MEQAIQALRAQASVELRFYNLVSDGTGEALARSREEAVGQPVEQRSRATANWSGECVRLAGRSMELGMETYNRSALEELYNDALDKARKGSASDLEPKLCVAAGHALDLMDIVDDSDGGLSSRLCRQRS